MREENNTDLVDSMLPLAMRVAAKTIGFDLVGDSDRWDVFDENDKHVDSVGGGCIPMSAPIVKLAYMDFIGK
jgi:hypothetical protein